jgi:hypothetical protein
MAVYPNDKQAAREATLLQIAEAVSGGAVTVAGDVELGATTVSNLQTAFTASNEGVRTDLAGIADTLNDILGELLDKIEAGEDVGLTEEAVTVLATAIATLFHYPTDYPDAGANTKLNEIKALIAALPTAGPLTDTQLRATPVPVSGTVAVSNQVANPTDFPDAAAQVKLDALHTDNGSATTTPPSSGAGIIGWLRGIYDKLNGTLAVSGAITVGADTVTGDTGQTALVTIPPTKVLSVTNVSGVQTLTFDLKGYKNVTLKTLSGTATGTVSHSPDNGTTLTNAFVYSLSSTGAVPSSGAITLGSLSFYQIPIRERYLVITTSAASSWNATLEASPFPEPTISTYTTAIGTATVDTELPAAAAIADALANPSSPQIASDSMQFNGTSWDRVRNNANVTVDTAGARTATGTGTTATNFNGRGAVIFIPVTAVSGSTPAMTVRVQVSYDGTTFVDLDTTNAQTASIGATGTYILHVYPGLTNAANSAKNAALPRTWRLAWTISGVTPSFTFSSIAAYVV